MRTRAYGINRRARDAKIASKRRSVKSTPTVLLPIQSFQQTAVKNKSPLLLTKTEIKRKRPPCKLIRMALEPPRSACRAEAAGRRVGAPSNFEIQNTATERRGYNEAAYLISTFAPAASTFFLISSASCLVTPSLIGLGAPSTSALASANPNP